MGAVAHMIFPTIPVSFFCVGFTALMLYVIIKFPYQKIAMILKWLCVSLLLYVAVPFMIKQDWVLVAKNTFIPTIQFNAAFISIIVALLGTTISPYLFFWQATMEAEDLAHNRKIIMINKRLLKNMKTDVNIGMFLSNLVMFFIILTSRRKTKRKQRMQSKSSTIWKRN